MVEIKEEPTEIFPYLLLGDSTVNENPDLVDMIGITHIVNMAKRIKPNCRLIFEKCLVYQHIMSLDSLKYNIRLHFEEAFEVIDDARCNNGRVLVHCRGGRSRSATIVIAYLMSRYNMSLQEAYSFVKCKREEVEPNKTFAAILQIYELELAMCGPCKSSRCGGRFCAYGNWSIFKVLRSKTIIPHSTLNTIKYILRLFTVD